MSEAVIGSAIQHFSTSPYSIGDMGGDIHDSDDVSPHRSPSAQPHSTGSAQFHAPVMAASVGFGNVTMPATETASEAEAVSFGPSGSPGTRRESPRGGELRSCLTRPVGGRRSTGRHVRFPEDGQLVTGAMPPTDPWSAVHVCSPEELVNSYRLACEAQSIRANPFIEEQLKAVSVRDVNERHGGLCLKNIKLDTRHCEALEQVLRRVRFVTLDLENTQLDDDAASMLFDMVEFYESAMRLSLAHNVRLTLRGWLACARMLKMTHSLEYLDVRHCVFNEHTITVLARALKLVAHLTVLHLEHAAVSGRVLATLVAALRLNESVREIYLSDSRLLPSDGVHLAALLKYNSTVQLLDLRNNTLQDVGLMHLCEGLAEQNGEQGLRTLILWNNQITHYAMAAFGRALAQSKCLELVNVGSNNLTNEGMHQLKEGLLKNKSILHFGVKATKITCEGAVALAEYIAECPQLQRIDLRGNDIRTGGLLALSLALRVNRALQQVDLDREPKREPGVEDYANTQKRLLDTIAEYTERNVNIVKLKEEVKQLLERQAESVRQSAAASESDSTGLPDVPVAPDVETQLEVHNEVVDIGVGEDKTTRADDPVCNPVEQHDEIEAENVPVVAGNGNLDDEEEPGPDEHIVVLAEQVTGSELTKEMLTRRKYSNSAFDEVTSSDSPSGRLSSPAMLIGRQLSPRNSFISASTPPATPEPVQTPSPPQLAPASPPASLPPSSPPKAEPIVTPTLTSTPVKQKTESSSSSTPLPSTSAATASSRHSHSFTLPTSTPPTTFVRSRFSVSLVSPEELGVSRTRLREISQQRAKAQRTASMSVSDDVDVPLDSDLLRVADGPVGGSRMRSYSASADS